MRCKFWKSDFHDLTIVFLAEQEMVPNSWDEYLHSDSPFCFNREEEYAKGLWIGENLEMKADGHPCQRSKIMQ